MNHYDIVGAYVGIAILVALALYALGCDTNFAVCAAVMWPFLPMLVAVLALAVVAHWIRGKIGGAS